MRLTGPRDGIATVKLIVLIMAALLLSGGGFFAWSKLRGGDEQADGAAAEEEAAEEQAVTTETLSLGEFLVNLRSADDTLRYLQAEVSIVVLVPKADDVEDESGSGHGGASASAGDANELPPASQRYARDIAIEVLSSESFEHLRDEADRSKLKATLQQKLDVALEAYEVQDVLFTAFVMQ